MNTTNPKLSHEDISSIAYFWIETGNLERWTGWERARPLIAVEYPEILNAWENYKSSMTRMDMAVKAAIE